MGWLPRSVDEAIAYAEDESVDPSRDWTQMCQMFVRSCYGVPAWGKSAIICWRSIPNNHKVRGGHPSDAPRGAAIYFDIGEYGHVALAIGKSTDKWCYSNDYVERGKIDKCDRTFRRWGADYKGWSAWTPFGEMNLATSTPPLWDGQVPSMEGVFNAMNHGYANPQAHRLACRLYDLGMFSGHPAEPGVQKYPVKAVGNLQVAADWAVNPEGAYSSELHDKVFLGQS